MQTVTGNVFQQVAATRTDTAQVGHELVIADGMLS